MAQFRKKQKLVCVHYKDRPVVKVIFTIKQSRHISGYTGPEIWVEDSKGRNWWGPPNWFKSLRKRKK